jgi:hypothetical protein
VRSKTDFGIFKYSFRHTLSNRDTPNFEFSVERMPATVDAFLYIPPFARMQTEVIAVPKRNLSSILSSIFDACREKCTNLSVSGSIFDFKHGNYTHGPGGFAGDIGSCSRHTCTHPIRSSWPWFFTFWSGSIRPRLS